MESHYRFFIRSIFTWKWSINVIKAHIKGHIHNLYIVFQVILPLPHQLQTPYSCEHQKKVIIAMKVE